jgi:DNA-directed RNA polymerase specialized sigma24 family protein
MRDATSACDTARRVGDPALQVRILAALLPIIGDDKLLHELRAIVDKVLAALPPETRQVFEEVPLVHSALMGRSS